MQRVGGGGVEPATEPAGGGGLGRRGRLPDGHRPEVAAVRLRVADAAEHGKLVGEIQERTLRLTDYSSRKLVGRIGLEPITN